MTLLYLAHFVFLARSARAHLYLLELLLVGSLGAFSTAAIELREANIEWDRSPVVVREAVVLNKSVSHSRKGGTRHYLHVRDWRDPTDTRKVMVSRAFYDAVVPGQVLVFHDVVGMYEGFRPTFVKRYTEAGGAIRDAVARYAAEVKDGSFPGEGQSFGMREEVLKNLSAH